MSRAPLRKQRLPRAAAVGALLTGLGVAMCAAPTEIVVDVYTDVPCAQRPRTGLATARDVALLKNAPMTSASERCAAEPQRVGRVVLRPPDGDKNATLAFQLVTRPDGGKPEDCRADTSYAGCIVARRQLRFTKGESIELAVHLRTACLDVSCGEGETCVRGACFSASVPDSCRDRVCDEPSLEGRPGGADAGADATLPTPPVDAGADASDAGASDASVVDADPGPGPTVVFDAGSSNVYGLSSSADSLVWTMAAPDAPKAHSAWEAKRPGLASARQLTGPGVVVPAPPIAALADGAAPFITTTGDACFVRTDDPTPRGSCTVPPTGLAVSGQGVLVGGEGFGLLEFTLAVADGGGSPVASSGGMTTAYLKQAAGKAYVGTNSGMMFVKARWGHARAEARRRFRRRVRSRRRRHSRWRRHLRLVVRGR